MRPFAVALLLGIALASSTAAAQARPDRPFYVGAGVGTSGTLSPGQADGLWLKLQEQIGFQFDPIPMGLAEGAVWLRIGADLGQRIGLAGEQGATDIHQFGVRLTAAFSVWSDGDAVLRVAPSVVLGGELVTYRNEACAACTPGAAGAAYGEIAAALELELLDGLLSIWARPAIEGPLARWDALLGVDVHL